MTRSQFLIVLYKKLFRPAILFIAGYYMVRFTMSLVKGEDISTGIIFPLITAAAFIALLYGMEKGAGYLVHKFPSTPVSQEDKSLKTLQRIADIALGMAILYVWQQNSGFALGMIIALAYGMISQKNKT